uniref:Potassium channel domain-containing protein n=1 Tax=Panagrolaimus sp. ES5 TaxID=591445 RepID=A0AC34FC03_9BILA
MMEGDFGSTQTWPKSQNPQKLLSNYQTRAHLQTTLANLKLYSKNDEKVNELVTSLYDVLAKIDLEKGTSSNAITAAAQRQNIGVIREEPHFESMILCDTTSSKPVSRVSSIQYVDGIDGETRIENIIKEDEIEPVTLYPKPKVTLWLRALPHTFLFTFAILYIAIGAELFRQVDPEIAKLPYHEALLLPFQICATIGWGNIPATTKFSQIITIIYAIFGIPITFGALANLGRLIVEGYCSDWIFLTAVVRQKPGVIEIKKKMPISGILNLLIAHQFLGLLLFNGILANFGVIESLYFNIVAIGMIGFGDIVPKPNNLFESIIIMLYISFGIVILSALLVSICYHFQRLYFVLLKNWLYNRWQRWNAKRKLSNFSIATLHKSPSSDSNV